MLAELSSQYTSPEASADKLILGEQLQCITTSQAWPALPLKKSIIKAYGKK
jgi:hypothetical protein